MVRRSAVENVQNRELYRWGREAQEGGRKADFLIQSDDDDDVALKNKNNRSSAHSRFLLSLNSPPPLLP